MAGRTPILGPLRPTEAIRPLQTIRKVNREAVLRAQGSPDAWQPAIVVEIDPIGGMFADPVGGQNPRWSIRARMASRNVEGGNQDSFMRSEELRVCFPWRQVYHDWLPVKKGELVWILRLDGLDGAAQRYWIHRKTSPSPLTLEPFQRPNANFADANYEANLLRDGDTTVSLDTDSTNTQSEQDPDTATTNVGRAADRTALRYGFVNEAFPELFFRESDRVMHGSNNHAIVLGTTGPTVESEEDAPDIADVISMFGFTNDGSGFANEDDPDLVVEGLAPIAAYSASGSALIDIHVGRRFVFPSLTFDAARMTVWEDLDIDGLRDDAAVFPVLSDLVTSVTEDTFRSAVGDSAALVRADNVRVTGRRSFALFAGSTSGLYADGEDGGTLLGAFDARIDLRTSDIRLTFERDAAQASLVVGTGTSAVLGTESLALTATGEVSAEAGGARLSLAPSALSVTAPAMSLEAAGAIGLQAASITLGFSNLSLGGVGVTASPAGLQVSAPIRIGTSPVATAETMAVASSALSAGASTLAAAAAPPAFQAAVVTLLQQLATILGNTSNFSTNLLA